MHTLFYASQHLTALAASFAPWTVMATAQAGAPAGKAGGIITFLPILFLLVAMYFFMYRPEKKKQQEHQATLDRMKVGDKVLTAGGIVGRVVNLSGDEVTIATSKANSLMTFKKYAVQTVINNTVAGGDDASKDDKAKKDVE